MQWPSHNHRAKSVSILCTNFVDHAVRVYDVHGLLLLRELAIFVGKTFASDLEKHVRLWNTS